VPEPNYGSPFWKMAGKILVESSLVCEAEMTAMVRDEGVGE
jgi:hypothetical protein